MAVAVGVPLGATVQAWSSWPCRRKRRRPLAPAEYGPSHFPISTGRVHPPENSPVSRSRLRPTERNVRVSVTGSEPASQVAWSDQTTMASRLPLSRRSVPTMATPRALAPRTGAGLEETDGRPVCISSPGRHSTVESNASPLAHQLWKPRESRPRQSSVSTKVAA